MNGGKTLFKIFGIKIKLHFSWYIIFVLLAYSLSTELFPRMYQNQTSIRYITWGITAAVLLFLSVLLHELSHSLVAKARKIPVKSITLFFFGGVASIEKEDMEPMTEFLMAGAGPAFSILFGFVSLLLFIYVKILDITVIFGYLAQINFILAAFNLLPGYPLDGGRMFRALLYGFLEDLKKATKIASTGGKIVGSILIFLGFGSLLFIQDFSGIWFIFIGAFLYFIAKISYEQLLIREALKDIKIDHFIENKMIKIPHTTKLNYMISHYSKTKIDTFFVTQNKKITGFIPFSNLKITHTKDAKKITAKDLMIKIKRIPKINKTEKAIQAFEKMSKSKVEFLPVYSKDKIIGTLSMKQLLKYMQLRLKYK